MNTEESCVWKHTGLVNMQPVLVSVNGSALSPIITRSGSGYSDKAWSKLQYTGHMCSGSGHRWAWPTTVETNWKFGQNIIDILMYKHM